MAELFEVVETNPNDTVGGGGCLCHDGKDTDCTGPYAVFYGNDMESTASPYPVLGLGCALAIVERAKGDVLVGGESSEDAVPEV